MLRRSSPYCAGKFCPVTFRSQYFILRTYGRCKFNRAPLGMVDTSTCKASSAMRYIYGLQTSRYDEHRRKTEKSVAPHNVHQRKCRRTNSREQTVTRGSIARRTVRSRYSKVHFIWSKRYWIFLKLTFCHKKFSLPDIVHLVDLTTEW